MTVFTSHIQWTGNRGTGTSAYKAYDRTWSVRTPGKPEIPCSNDPALGGDPTLHNPEDLLLNALAACHMLWFLHLASDTGITVTAYHDTPEGVGETETTGVGRFLSATLHPQITLTSGTPEAADAIHGRIHKVCYIARSVNFPVYVKARYQTG